MDTELMRNGGWPMWPLLFVGSTAILAALRAALRGPGRPSAAGLTRLLTVATASLSVMGTALDFNAVFFNIPRAVPLDRLPFFLMRGFGEALSPLILGTLLIALTCLIAAIAPLRGESANLPSPPST
jgi:hypothetical protein